MKKKVMAVLLGMTLALTCLSGCGNGEQTKEEAGAVQTEESAEETEAAQEETVTVEETEAAQEETVTAEESTEEASAAEEESSYVSVTVKIGSLKGPTSMGLVSLMDKTKKGEAANDYQFTMATGADELLPKMISGDLDIVLVPANVASVLYNKTNGGVCVIDINTLGVLYMVSGDTSIQSMEDLKGKTIYLTGKGTTPDYVLQYLLTQNGMTTADVTLEYKSEATEVAALLAENTEAIGLLPQPFVTAACMKNEALSVVMDLNEQWNALQKDQQSASSMVTGVTVVRKAFLEENQMAVAKFMKEHKESAAFANENVEAAAELVAAEGIIEKAPIAAKAMPKCNITYIDGEQMKTALSGYLSVLFEQDAASVGGSLPADDFYYLQPVLE